MSVEGSLFCSLYSRQLHGSILAQIVLQRHDMQSDIANGWFSVKSEDSTLYGISHASPAVHGMRLCMCYCVLVGKVAEG